MSRRRGRVHGTPTVNPPEAQAIDPWSGFKIPHKDLVKQWDGQWVWSRTVDRRNPQDWVRGVKDDMSIPHPRPESPDEFVASALLWEDGETIMTVEGNSGNVILSEGVVPGETL